MNRVTLTAAFLTFSNEMNQENGGMLSPIHVLSGRLEKVREQWNGES